jgi:hypothetical protein
MSDGSVEIISHSSTSSAELMAFPSDSDKLECCAQSISQGIDSPEITDSDQLESSVPSSSRGIDSANSASVMPTSHSSGKILSKQI